MKAIGTAGTKWKFIFAPLANEQPVKLPQENKSLRPVVLWLLILCAMIMMMVGVGGITRLTGSGLSIVDWKPIMGAIPPLNGAQWIEVFGRYQLSPQFKLLNHNMSLADFKFIYFWEYIHRLLGRGVGVVFLFPWLFFVVSKKVQGKLAGRLLVGFALGGLQGVLGWFMVMSGLVEKPYVSHYRLAAHLSLALLVLSYLFWIVLDLLGPRLAGASSKLSSAFKSFTSLVCLQIIYGAFTAGLKAGFGYNTFPKMMDHWIAPEAWGLTPFWMNLLANPAMVQFIHRSIGWCVLVSIVGLYVGVSRNFSVGSVERRAAHWLLLAVFIQFSLGVSTLVLAVPIPLAVLHQMWACVVLLSCLRMNHILGGAPSSIPSLPISQMR